MIDIIDKIIPQRELTILGGAAQAGKTTLLMQILCQIQRGELVFGKFKAQSDLEMIYIAADRTWRSYVKTADNVGLDLSSIKVKALVDDTSFNRGMFEEQPLHYLRTIIESLLPSDRRHATVWVDPLIIWLGCDLNRYNVVAARLIALNQLCNELNITLFGTHHANKMRTDSGFVRALDRLNGSAGIGGFTSTQLFLSLPEECGNEYGYSELTITSHHAYPITLWLERGDKGLFNIAEKQPKTKEDGLHQRILSLLHTSELTRAEIIEKMDVFGKSTKTTDRALSKLKKEGKILKSGSHFTAVGV